MSRAVYGGLERSMMEERLKNAQMAAASDPTGYMPPIERPSH